MNTLRSARLLPLSAATLVLAAPAAASTPATTVPTTTAPTTPASLLHLSARWSVVRERCHEQRLHDHLSIRRCAPHAYSVHRQAIRLAWHQHGEVRGQLTNAGVPVAGATITLTHAIKNHQTRTSTVITGAGGRYTAVIHAPSGVVTVTYSTASASRRVIAQGYLSLHVTRLRAGHRGEFTGRVAGGFMPHDGLYVQLWYLAGRDGWQPFAELAHVRRTGLWSTRIPIPRRARGYHYEIHATVVRSPYWPFAQTTSPVVRRRVR